MTKRTSLEFARTLGGRLFELRKELKLHQRDMAMKMGISERVYRRYEAGEQVPGSDKLMALFDDLKDLSSTWLLTGNGRMFKSLDPPELRDVLLDIIAGNQSIQRIVVLLKGLNDEDLEGVLHQVMERKRLRDLQTELRSMMKKLERSAFATTHEEKPE